MNLRNNIWFKGEQKIYRNLNLKGAIFKMKNKIATFGNLIQDIKHFDPLVVCSSSSSFSPLILPKL